MKWIVNTREMKQCDENTSAYYGISSDVLMEHASAAFCHEMQNTIDCAERILVLCGKGNNGGDGLCIARMLHLSGKDVTVFFPLGIPDKNTLCYEKKSVLERYGVKILDGLTTEFANLGISHWTSRDIIIDAVFGTGLSRTLDASLESVFHLCNESNAVRFAVDIPSGISGDNGRLFGEAFCADHTVTFAFCKIGQLLSTGASYCGNVHCVEMGITKESFLESKPHCFVLEENDLSMIPKRPKNAHKGSFSRILVVAGSKNMAGAAYFAAKAAYRTGAGFVSVYTAEENRIILQSQLPEAVLLTYPSGKPDVNILREALKKADIILIGPGIGTETDGEKIVAEVLKNAAVPLIVDADAINLIAKDTSILKNPHPEMVLTPHLREMSRLCSDSVSYLNENMMSAATDFANEYNVICHLKNARSVTALPFGKTYITVTGNSAMATAGSGDVLTGIIAGLFSLGMSLEDAVPFGAMIHGLAGSKASVKLGKDAVMASDIIDQISTVMKERECNV